MKIRSLLVTLLFVAVAFLSTNAQKQDNSLKTKSVETKATENSLIQGRIWNNNLSVQGLRSAKGVLSYTFQDFEDVTFPPTGWTLLQIAGTTSYWTRNATCSGYGIGTAAAKYNFYSSSNGTEAIQSPVFAASLLGDVLKFDYAHAAYTTEDDQLSVETSSDGGTTWVQLALMHGNVVGDLSTVAPQSGSFTPTATQWATKTLTLPVGTTQIRLVAISDYGNNLFVDNITVGTPPANDVGVFSLDFAVNNMPGVIVPMLTVKNFGSAVQTFPVKLTIGAYTSTKTVTALAAGTSVQVTFDNWNAALGTYPLSCYTQLAGDVNSANDTLTSTINISNSTWTTGATFGFTTYMGDGAGYVSNDTAYAFTVGGNTTPAGNNLVARYNVNANTWTNFAPVPVPRLVSCSAVLQGKLYLLGGSDGTNYMATIYVLDIATNTWSLSPVSLPTPRGWGRAVTYQDSLIYITGGLASASGSADGAVYVFNVNTNTVRTCTTMPGLMFGGGLAIFENQLVTVGGAGAAIYADTYVGTISQLDRSVITWVTKTPYPAGPRFKNGAGAWGTKGIVVTGGNDGAGGAYWTPLNDHYQYNPTTDTWTALTPCPVAILGYGSASFKVGNQLKWVLVGGYDGAAALNTTNIYLDEDVVPVELSSFTSNVVNNEVQLRWTTTTEKNNKGFNVERKSNNSNWEVLGFVSGKGTTTEINNYSFTDKVNGSNYSYRLKQVDFDGTFEYSQVINVDLTGPKVYLLSQNYPNPFNPSTLINFGLASDSKVSVKVYDVLGRVVATLFNGSLEAGSHQVQFNAKSITSGVYFYTIEANGVDGSKFSATKKMILTK